MSEISMRQVRGMPVKFETREESENIYISGYFAVFNSDYEIWPGATELSLIHISEPTRRS